MIVYTSQTITRYGKDKLEVTSCRNYKVDLIIKKKNRGQEFKFFLINILTRLMINICLDKKKLQIVN